MVLWRYWSVVKLNRDLRVSIELRERTEQALRKSEAKLEEAQRTAQIGNWEFNTQTNELIWSDEAYRIFGTSPEEFQPTVEAFYAFVHPDDQALVRAIVGEVEQTKDQSSIEHRIILRGGEIRWVQQENASVEGTESVTGRRHGTIQDITERKNAEIALRESEQYLINIADNIADSVVTIDEAGIILSFNKAAEDAFGYGAEEVIGGSVERLMPEDYAVRHAQYVANYLESGQSAILGKGPRELEGRHKDGSTFPIELAISEMNVVGRRTFIGTIRDITDRNLARDKLRASEMRLAEAQRIANIGSWEQISPRGKFDDGVLIWSDQTFRIFGIDPAEQSPSLELFYERVHPEDRERHKQAINRTLAGKSKLFESDHRIVLPSGEVRYVQERGEIVYDDSGAAERSVGTVQDVTEQVLIQEQLHQAQKMEAVGQLTGGIAHDFNNLLTVIVGSLHLVRDDVKGKAASVDVIDRGVKAAERGSALTDRLMAFSRKQTLLPADVDVNELVIGMSDMLNLTLGDAVSISYELSDNLWPCHVDPGQLENAVLNLAINARDAMPQGGRFRVSTANLALEEGDAGTPADLDTGEYIVLGVSDTGHGVPREHLEHVFEPFFTTKAIGEGSGLGLSMVYGFAKQSGGAATIDSRVGQGTTVNIYLQRTR